MLPLKMNRDASIEDKDGFMFKTIHGMKVKVRRSPYVSPSLTSTSLPAPKDARAAPIPPRPPVKPKQLPSEARKQDKAGQESARPAADPPPSSRYAPQAQRIASIAEDDEEEDEEPSPSSRYARARGHKPRPRGPSGHRPYTHRGQAGRHGHPQTDRSRHHRHRHNYHVNAAVGEGTSVSLSLSLSSSSLFALG